MISKLFAGIEAKMVALYMAATVILYGSFWLGWYSGMLYNTLLTLALVFVVVFAVIFFVFKNTTWAPMLTMMITITAIGFVISAFFVATRIVPSRFWGLCLLIMLAYKTAQALLGRLFGSRTAFYAFCTVLAVLEAIATAVVGVFAFMNGPLTWQVFFALLICVFYSLGQIALRKNSAANFWKTAATSFLKGFVFIFVLVVILILSDGELDFGGGEKSGKGSKAAAVSGKGARPTKAARSVSAGGAKKSDGGTTRRKTSNIAPVLDDAPEILADIRNIVAAVEYGDEYEEEIFDDITEAAPSKKRRTKKTEDKPPEEIDGN